MLPDDFMAEKMNTSRLFMVFGRTSPPPVTSNQINQIKKPDASLSSGSRQVLSYFMELVRIRSGRNTVWNSR